MTTADALAIAGTLGFLALALGLLTLHYRRVCLSLGGSAELARRSPWLNSNVFRHDHLLFADTSVACVVWEPGFRVIDWNRQAENLFGWEREEMLGRSFVSVLLPVHARNRFIRDLAALFADGIRHQIAMPHLTRGGKIVTCEWQHTVVYDDHGAPVRVVSLCLHAPGVSDPPLDKLDSSLFRQVLDLADTPAIMILDFPEGRIVFAGDAARRHFGQGQTELLGLRPAQWDPHFAPDLSVEAVLGETDLVSFESLHRHSSGNAIPVGVELKRIESGGESFVGVFIRDISETKASEKPCRECRIFGSLQRQERRHREVFEHASNALFVVNVEDKNAMYFDNLNQAAVDAFGLPFQTLSGHSLADIARGCLGPDVGRALGRQLRHYRACIETGMPSEFEDELALTPPHDTAAQRRFHIKLVPLVDDRGIERIIGIGHDLTPRIRYESELRERATFERLVLDSLHQVGMYMLWLKDGRIAHLSSPQLAFDLGYTDADIASRPAYLDIIHPDDRERVAEMYRRRMAGEPVTGSYEVGVLTRHGQRREYEISASRRVDSGIDTAIVICKDIGARKRMERALDKERATLHSFINTLPALAWMKDVEGRYLFCNPAFEEFIGKPAADIVGKTDFDLLAPEQAAFFRERDRDALNASHPCISEETRTLARTGRRVHLEITKVAVRDARDEIIGVLGFSHDVTERKNTELRLRESRALLRDLGARREDALEDERKRIARDLHEELGQLLTVLRINVSTLPIEYGKAVPAIHDRSKSMLQLIDRAIKGTREVVTSLRPAVLNAGLAAGIEWLVEEFSHHTGIECVIRPPAEWPTTSDMQATAIFRIVQEALTNAARHSCASRVDINVGCDAARCRIEVRDNGCGFAPEQCRKGSFGLINMRERAAGIAGECEIVSRPGQGTMVRIAFPAPLPPSPADATNEAGSETMSEEP